jgi:hypothetical protein
LTRLVRPDTTCAEFIVELAAFGVSHFDARPWCVSGKLASARTSSGFSGCWRSRIMLCRA